MIFFQNTLVLQVLPACNGCFGLYTKTKKWSDTSFWCSISAWFLHKKCFYYILYQLTKFQCHIFFPSKDIKQNVIKYPYLENYWYHQLRFIFDYPLKQWPIWKKKRGRWKYKKLEEWNEVFRSIKSMLFSQLFKACVRYFHQIFIFFHQMIALQKLWKMLFNSSKKLFWFSRYSIFCISVLPSFSTCRPLL